MCNPKITRAEFVALLRADVEAFDEHWRSMGVEFPENYPPDVTMGVGDWWDQFLSFESLQGRNLSEI
jgi:hypothetical protein